MHGHKLYDFNFFLDIYKTMHVYIYTHVVRQASCLLCLGCFYSAVGCLHHPISCCHLAATTTHAHDTSSLVTPHHHPLDASFLLVLVPSSFRPPNEPMIGDKSDAPSHRHHHSQRPSPNLNQVSKSRSHRSLLAIYM